MSSKLAIGAAQFGMDYGVANKTGQVTPDAVHAILDLASKAGIDTIDTAVSYGASEEVLGQQGISGFRIVTKVPRTPPDVRDVEGWLRKTLEASLNRLCIDCLAGVLLHDCSELDEDGGKIARALIRMRDEGLTEKIGCSIYAPSQLETIDRHFAPDLIQAPFNVFDRRIDDSGWLAKLALRSVEVHTRSAFLQGLLLMPPEQRPEKFRRWQQAFEAWDSWLARSGCTALQGALGFATSEPRIGRVVVGVDSPLQLEQVISAAGVAVPQAPASLQVSDERLIDPSQWRHL